MAKYKHISGGKINIIQQNEHSIFEKQWLFMFIAFLLPVLLYLKTLSFGFVSFDDDKIITDNLTFLSSIKNIGLSFSKDAFISGSSLFYRPLQTASFIVDIFLGGKDFMLMMHLTNLLLLGSFSFLLFLMLRQFSIEPGIALFGALFYSCHPLFVSSVAWIPARGDLQLAFFSILSFLFLIEFIKSKKITFLLLNWLTFTIALFCKETAVALIPLFIIYYLLFSPERKFDKRNIPFLILYGISVLIWFFIRLNALKGFSDLKGLYGMAAILSNLRTIPEGVAKFILPFNISPLPVFSTLLTLTGILIIVSLSLLIFRTRKFCLKENVFGLIWFLVLMLPPMVYRNPHFDYLDHRFFLPMTGLLLVIILVINDAVKKINVWQQRVGGVIVIVMVFEVVGEPEQARLEVMAHEITSLFSREEDVYVDPVLPEISKPPFFH